MGMVTFPLLTTASNRLLAEPGAVKLWREEVWLDMGLLPAWTCVEEGGHVGAFAVQGWRRVHAMVLLVEPVQRGMLRSDSAEPGWVGTVREGCSGMAGGTPVGCG